jgi:hypothetical protein
MAKQRSGQRKTVGRVMHEWKHGELEGSRGGRVKSRRQAVAIALSEAGSSNQQSRSQNRRQRARTKTKERRGEALRGARPAPRARSSIARRSGVKSRGGRA